MNLLIDLNGGIARFTLNRPDVHNAFDEVENAELRETIFEAMGELSVEHRAVVQLRLVDEMSLEETARLLRCRPGTVNSRLHYACEHLRRKLTKVKKPTD